MRARMIISEARNAHGQAMKNYLYRSIVQQLRYWLSSWKIARLRARDQYEDEIIAHAEAIMKRRLRLFTNK